MKKDKKLILADILILLASLYLALLLRFDFNIESEYAVFFRLSIIPIVIISLVFNNLFKLYDSMWKYASVEQFLSVVYSVSLSNILFLMYSYALTHKVFESNYYRFPFTVLMINWCFSIIGLGGIRFFLKKNSKNVSGDNVKVKKKMLIIGAGDAGVMSMKEIQKHSNLNYEIIGFIDDDDEKKGRLINGIRVIGGREVIESTCEENNIEEILISIPSADFITKSELIKICNKTKCKLKIVPGIYEIIKGKVSYSHIRDVKIEDLLGREEITLNNENISEYIENKVVLVTGGGGSIGSELCRQIAKYKPSKLVILDIYENNAYVLEQELKYEFKDLDIEVIIASIRDLAKIRDVFQTFRPYVVFHAAAHKHVPLMEHNPGEAVKNNIIGTYNVVSCSHEFKVKRFVAISTDKAVNPTNIMGATKRFCECIIQAFDTLSETEYVAVRFGNVLGSNGSVIPLFKKQIAHGGPVTVTHPEITRFFMTIPEASQLVIQAGAMAKGGEIFVLDMGEPVKMVELARDLIKLSGFKPDEEIEIKYIGLRPGEKLYEELLIDKTVLASTEHEKIFVEKPQNVDFNFILKSIEEFKDVVRKNEKELIFKLMEQKVPTYKRKKVKQQNFKEEVALTSDDEISE